MLDYSKLAGSVYLCGLTDKRITTIRDLHMLHHSILMMFSDKYCGTKRIRLAYDLEQMLFAS